MVGGEDWMYAKTVYGIASQAMLPPHIGEKSRIVACSLTRTLTISQKRLLELEMQVVNGEREGG